MGDPLPSRGPWSIPPFLGRIPAGLAPEQLRLLSVVALALLFEEYDGAMLISALKHIARDLRIADEHLGMHLGLIRLGAVPAFFLVPLADRHGRRAAFVFSTVALGLLTFATAFVVTPGQFVVLQAFGRTFFVTGTAVAFVIVTEEFPAEHRGWGMGMLAALGSMGHGLSAILFSQIERLPFGWRSLYVVGIVPVLMLPAFLARVPETRRFREMRAGVAAAPASAFASVIGPMRSLFVAHPSRAAALSACGFFAAAATLPSFQFSGFYTLEKLGWEPAHYSGMVVAGGAIGIVGNIAAGRLGDVFGRRIVGFVLLSLFPLASFAFYRGGSWVVAPSWIPLVFCFMGGRVILKALSTELFQTSFRGAAAGLFGVMEALGAVAGLFAIHAYQTDDVDRLARAVPYAALLVVIAACLVLLFPETKQRELEEIVLGGS